MLNSGAALRDHLVGSRQKRGRDIKSRRFRNIWADDQLDFVWKLDRKLARFRAVEYSTT
jgi:hypothetical protein